MAIFYIVDTDGSAIIGLPSSRELKLITIHCSIEKVKVYLALLKREFPENFEGIGRFPGKFHITLDTTVTPVVQSPRRCALAIR